MGIGMEVKKGAKVSYNGLHNENIVGIVVGFGGEGGYLPLIMASGCFVKSWMHSARAYKLYESVGGSEIELPVKGDFYYYISKENLKVLGYE